MCPVYYLSYKRHLFCMLCLCTCFYTLNMHLMYHMYHLSYEWYDIGSLGNHSIGLECHIYCISECGTLLGKVGTAS